MDNVVFSSANPVAGYALDYPTNWFVNAGGTGDLVDLTSFDPSQALTGSAPDPGDAQIEIAYKFEVPDLATIQRMIAAGNNWLLRSKDWTSISGISGLYVEAQGEYLLHGKVGRGEMIYLYIPMGDRSLEISATGELTQFASIINTLRTVPQNASSPTPGPYLPLDLYPSPSPFITPVNGLSTSGCPNPAGIKPKSELTLEEAFQVLKTLNSGQPEAMRRVSDPTFWNYFYLPTNGTPTPIEKGWLTVKLAGQSEYAGLIQAGCGQEILGASREAVNCGSTCQTAPSPAVFSHYFLINRNGAWLIWASYP